MGKGDKKRAQRLRRLVNAERMKRSYARIRTALQEKRHGGITSLKVVEQDDTGNDKIVEITDPAEIQQRRILERNKDHFKQAHEMLFFDSRLLDLINDTADNDLCEDILDRREVNMKLENFDKVEEFVQAMARLSSIQDDEERIPYTIIKEKTSRTDLQNGKKEHRHHHPVGTWAITSHGYKTVRFWNSLHS
jgi:5'-3' exonuclease